MIFKIDKEIEINTFEAYNNNVFIVGANDIVIPYVNIEIFDIFIEFKNLKKYDKINYSYLFFKDVKEIKWDYIYDGFKKEKNIRFESFLNEEKINIDYLNVFNALPNNVGCELKIEYFEQFLYLPNNFKTANRCWIPFDTPNFPKNIDADVFFNNFKIPQKKISVLNSEINTKTIRKINPDGVLSTIII